MPPVAAIFEVFPVFQESTLSNYRKLVIFCSLQQEERPMKHPQYAMHFSELIYEAGVTRALKAMFMILKQFFEFESHKRLHLCRLLFRGDMETKMAQNRLY
jgi:hypothetical protein